MSDLDIYLDTLFEGLEGLIYSPVKTPTGFETNSSWYNWPSQKEELKAHILSDKGDVYISPAVYSEKRGKKDAIKKIQMIWIDFDGMDQIDFKNVPPPSLIVQTSFESKVHCYWKVEASNQTSIEDANRRLAYYLGSDNGGWDSVQLLRPPCTVNYKRNLPVVLADRSGSTYTLEQFDFVPKVAAPILAPIVVTELIPVKDVLSNHQLPFKLVRMVLKENPSEPYRSSFLARLSNELAEEGLSHLEIVSCLVEADGRIQKYSDRSDQLVRLSQIADYAIHKKSVEETVLVYTPTEILHHVENLQWILPNWLHTTGQLMISSAPGVGKTQMMLQLAYCLEFAGRFLGFSIKDKHKPFFMSLEMDVRTLKYILSHQKEHWDKDPAFPVIDEASNLIGYENLIEELKPTVVIVDSLTELFDDTADNASAEARRVMLWCRKIRRRYGVAIILIHHNRKPTEGNKKPKGLGDLMGSFQFGKDSDTVLQVWEDHKGIELSAVKARFGLKEAFMIKRNEHLWFERDGHVDNEQRAVQPDKARDSGLESLSFRHGDEHNGPRLGAFPIRFGNQNG